MAIDHLANERMERLFEMVAADKHEGLRAQARRACAREFLVNQREK